MINYKKTHTKKTKMDCDIKYCYFDATHEIRVVFDDLTKKKIKVCRRCYRDLKEMKYEKVNKGEI